MLKWTVGHRKRSPSAGGGTVGGGNGGASGPGPCYSIRRAAAKLRRRSRGSSSGSGFESRQGDKENRNNDPEAYISPPRTRDSVYMRLDSIPAALRDLSNQQPPATASPSINSPVRAGEQDGVKRSRSRPRKIPRTPRFPQDNPTLRPSSSPLQIEYSPCALQNTSNLLTLRRRIPSTLDNPLYFSQDDVPPIKVRRKEEMPLSPLSRNLASLRLSSGSTDSPSVQMPIHHDVTDPRFLSTLSESHIRPHSSPKATAESSLVATKPKPAISSPVVQSDSTVVRKSSSAERPRSEERTCVNRKPSLRRTRTLSEDGPPKKVTIRCEDLDPSSVRRRSRLLGLGDGVFACPQSCDSVFQTERKPAMLSPPSVDFILDDTMDDNTPFTLKRQGGIRRRHKRTPRSESCLTLPYGVPSPFTVGLPIVPPPATLPSPVTFSCSDIPRRLGLTLPRGIPSPCSQDENQEEDDYEYSSSVGIAGVQPLSTSPARPLMPPPLPEVEASTAVVAWKPTQQEQEGSTSSSDETWNSHNAHFLKSPHLTAGHILAKTNLDEEEKKASSSSSAGSSVAAVGPSPLALVERRSRSRRCLLFASPGGPVVSSRRHSSMRRSPREQYRGELELGIYGNSGLLTIHVICGRNLYRMGGKGCNAYVKVALIPAGGERTFHRTSVHRESSNPWFDQKFSFELLQSDMEKRVFVSAWHRDKVNRRSEFLGCMSFAVKHAVKKEISGSFQLLSQGAGRTQHVAATGAPGSAKPVMMAAGRRSDSSAEEIVSIDESDVQPTPALERRRSCPKKKPAGHDDSSFLRHLELEPTGDSGPGRGPAAGPAGTNKTGRTPFTTTRRLTRQGNSGFGFSIAWTQPPRIERVEAGLPADRSGLRPGDYVIFVERQNVVTMPEEQILQLIHSCGDTITLEVYRRAGHNGLAQPAPTRSSTTNTTTTSLDLSKRRLHLPQVTFSSENEPLNREEARRQAVYQLLNKEQHYALCLQFGLSRFLLPLAERRDLLNANEHLTLFQNAEELLRLTEDTLEQLIHEDSEPFVQSLGRVYLKKMPTLSTAYRRYFAGLKKADCLLVAKTRNPDFMRIINEPPVPRRRPDLTAFIHKPLEHFRDILKLLQTILIYTKVNEEDYPALSKVVQELQATYRDATVGSGLMEPEVEGRPLLTLQDLESRLVFTRCKPFVLSAPGRQWIFGGDLSRVEGRAVRPFWTLLFTDMLLFAKVSRDRVLFITEEPLSLLNVTQAFFNIRKRANEFRLQVDGGAVGTDSPAPGGCGPELPLTRNPKKGTRRRTIALRAPTAELKAVWQNLIQRQIIYLNTTRGGTPISSPLDSPDPPTTLSVATLDSYSLRRQGTQQQQQQPAPPPPPAPPTIGGGASRRQLDELIEHKCRQLGKSGANKGSALHLAQWMKGQLGAAAPQTPDEEPEPEVWSPETLRRRSEQLQVKARTFPRRSESRCEEIEMSDVSSLSRSRSQTSSDSQVTVKSCSPEKPVAVCRQCHKTCLANNNNNNNNTSTETTQQPTTENNNDFDLEEGDDDEYDDNWGPLILMGMTALNATMGLGGSDPFSPSDVPLISVLPPTPDTHHSGEFQWDDADLGSPDTSAISPSSVRGQLSPSGQEDEDEDEDEEDEDEDEEDEDMGMRQSAGSDEPPYRSLKRYGTLASLEMLEDREDEDEEDEEEEEEERLASKEQRQENHDKERQSNEQTEQQLIKRFEEEISSAHELQEKLKEHEQQCQLEQQCSVSRQLQQEKLCNELDRQYRASPPYERKQEYQWEHRYSQEIQYKQEIHQDLKQNLQELQTKKQEPASPSPPQPQEVVGSSLRGWTARAGSFVAEKMALFERLGEESRAAAFLDRNPRNNLQPLLQPKRYLRPTSPPQPVIQPRLHTAGRRDSPPSPPNTGSTSGEEIWGTPSSGDLPAFPSPAQSTTSSPGEDNTELMMDELLASPPLASTSRFPTRRRLEPLPEEEDTNDSSGLPEKETPSPEQDKEFGVVADIVPVQPPPPPPRRRHLRQDAPSPPLTPVDCSPVRTASEVLLQRQQREQQEKSHSFFSRLRLKRDNKNGHLLGFLGRRSAEKAGLWRLFQRDSVDDIPTSLPRQPTPRHRQNGKQLERRFWKQLRRRRSGNNQVTT